MYQRWLQTKIESNLSKQKVGLLLGARRVGKTALLQAIQKNTDKKTLWLNGEDVETQAILEKRSVANYERLLKGYNLLIIDEAHYVKDIGAKAKLMIDQIKPLHIILTGSSSFDLIQSGEGLTGRTISYQMFPIAQLEMKQYENLVETKQALEERLIFGYYPELLQQNTILEKQQYLNELLRVFLLKDILAFEDIRNPQKIRDLLGLIAHQVGSEVSLHELGKQLGMSKNTVERYLDLLEKVFLIFRRKGYSKNMRKEIVKSSRWYFFDNGIRNALIGNFNLPAMRQDMGQLWENYFISERLKRNSYFEHPVNSYFWRTYDQQEIDLVEENADVLTAFECKWKEQKVKKPTAFDKAYPAASFHIAHQNDYLRWVEE